MSQHAHSDNGTLVADLQSTEKALKASENLRLRAIANKGAYESQLKDNDDELEALGTTAEKAEEEVAFIDREISDKLEKINGMIPLELLKRYNLI